MPVRIAVVEDDKQMRSMLNSYIDRYAAENDELLAVDLFTDGEEIINDYRPVYGIIFLDIQMHHLDGMETAHLIREVDQDVIIIFITNMANYAIKGYAVDALDFVLKPVSYFAFSQQLKKALSRLSRRASHYITVPVENGLAKVETDRILYLESFGHKIVLYTDGEEYSFNDSMKNMEKTLGDHGFYRSNNCYLINLAYVRGVQGNIAVVAGRQLTISRARKKGLMQALSNFIGANS